MRRSFFLFICVFIVSFLYIILSVYVYYSSTVSLESFYEQRSDELSRLRDIVKRVHDEDSRLYRQLLIREREELVQYERLYSYDNSSKGVISGLLNLREEGYFSEERIASTLDEYYALESLRSRILELHRLELGQGGREVEEELALLLREYENQVRSILEGIENEIETSKELEASYIIDFERALFRNLLLLFLLYFTIVLILIYREGIFSYLFSSSGGDKFNGIDSEMRAIVEYVGSEISKGSFPTMKEVKQKFEISHPTLVSKVRFLEEKGILYIRKKGRSKYLILR